GTPAPAVPPAAVASPTPTPASSEGGAVAAPSWDAVSYRTAINEGVEAVFLADPLFATEGGDHPLDEQLPHLRATAQLKIAADLVARAQGLRAVATSVPVDAAPEDAGTDHPALDARLLAGRLEGIAYLASTFRPLERDPSEALSVVGRAIASITNHEYAPKH